MTTKPQKLSSQDELTSAERAFRTVFKTTETFVNPFQTEITKCVILFSEPYALEGKYLNAIGRSALESGDTNIAYISLIEGLSGNEFSSRFHWSFDLFDYPYEELRKDEDWFPLMENAIYSLNGAWGIIFSEYGHAIIGGSNLFFDALERQVPQIHEDVYLFLAEIKVDIESSRKTVPYFQGWLPNLLSSIYGSSQAATMLADKGLDVILSP